MRISRAVALAGIDSRRKCEEHVRNGAITVNGEVVRDLGRQVNPEEDAICFRGRLLLYERMVYFVMHKPEGYTVTAMDSHAEKTVYDLLPPTLIRASRQPRANRTRVFPVGRLDKNSTGLLLFTNDGDLANQMTHPKFGIEKWYQVRLDRAFEPIAERKLLQGVRLEDGYAKAEKIVTISRRVLQVMIKEGRKREVRRLFEAVGFEVVRLCRVTFGPLGLGTLAPGEGRFLRKPEIEILKRACQEQKAE